MVQTINWILVDKTCHQEPFIITWIYCNPGMDKNYIHYKGWDEITYTLPAKNMEYFLFLRFYFNFCGVCSQLDKPRLFLVATNRVHVNIAVIINAIVLYILVFMYLLEIKLLLLLLLYLKYIPSSRYYFWASYFALNSQIKHTGSKTITLVLFRY